MEVDDLRILLNSKCIESHAQAAVSLRFRRADARRDPSGGGNPGLRLRTKVRCAYPGRWLCHHIAVEEWSEMSAAMLCSGKPKELLGKRVSYAIRQTSHEASIKRQFSI